MILREIKNKIESKDNFYKEIKIYYTRISNERIPQDLLDEIILKVTDEIYSDYQRFWKKYPKSRKRYSMLKLEDIDHAFTRFLITDLLKEKDDLNYREYSKILFKMNDKEFDEYELRKYHYETK